MIIPKTDLTIHYILSELEELEREDTFRLKRVKEKKTKKVKEDGAGEQIEDTHIDSNKINEEASKPEEAKAAADDKEALILVEPKEAAEMGDLIVIKLPDDGMELGDVFIPPPGMKTMATFTEVDELLDEISDFDLKEEEKEPVEDSPVDKEIKKAVKNDVENFGGNLETGEWFESPSKIANTAILNVNVSEYNKVDNLDDVFDGEKTTNDRSAEQIPLKSDDSVIDLADKRALDSLYKGIDFNFYKPTIDDIFSKHDFAIKDNVSLQEISILDESLVDLESLDFSIDSKGKVVLSKPEQISPVISLYHREVDDAKPMAKYDEEELLIGPTNRLPSVKWQTNGLTENAEPESQIVGGVDSERVELNLKSDNVKSTVEDTDEVTKDEVSDNELKLRNDLLRSIDSKPIQNSRDENLNNKSEVSLEEIELWASDREQIHKNMMSDGLATEQVTEDKNIKTNTKTSRSNLIKRDASKLSTLVEESTENEIDEEKVTSQSTISIKNGNVDTKNKSQINDNELQNINNDVLEMKTHENIIPLEKETAAEDAKPKVYEKTKQQYKQSNLKINEKQENFKRVSSAKSSRDLRQNKDQTANDQLSNQSIAEEISQSETRKLSTKLEIRSRHESIVNDLDTNVKESMEKVELQKNTDFGQEYKSSLHENVGDKLNQLLDGDVKRDLQDIQSKRHESIRNSQINADDIKNKEKDESQDKHQLETETKTNIKENINKPLKIQHSDEVIQNQEDKIISKDSQSKEGIIEEAADIEENERSDNERSTSYVNKSGTKQNKDKTKQDG